MRTLTPSSSLLAGLALAGSVFLTETASGQMLPGTARKSRHYNTVAVHLNAMNYFGDLVPKPSFTSFRLGATRPNLGFSLTHRFAPRLAGRVSLSYGRITGDDKKAADKDDPDAIYRYNRNLRFRNDIIEVSGVGILELFENRGSYIRRRDISPYLFAGLAFFYHNPKAPDSTGTYRALQPLGTEGQKSPNRAARGYEEPYKRFQIAIPFGLGVTYKLNRQLNVGYEIGWRKTFTDYLDDVSNTYADPRDLQNRTVRYLADPSDKNLRNDPRFRYSYGFRGQQRGTDNRDDWYISSGFYLSYILVPNEKSPKFR